MSPFELRFLLHCYYSPEPFEAITNKVIGDFAEQMLTEGILLKAEEKNCYTVTEKGRVWVERILATPQPIQKWV